MSDAEAAEAARARCSELIQERRFIEAVEPAAEWCRLKPESAGAWWDYGVALKHARKWEECLAACERAIELDPEDCAGPNWNAGIAATALGNWSRARAGWARCGVEMPEGEGPIEMKLAIACVRVASEGEREVVWCRRIDPCRARLVSVPLPASKHQFGDLVLHDGEPRGRRRHGSGEVAVFDELARLEPSSYGTWEVTAECATPAMRDELVTLFDDVDGSIEDWTESLVLLCTKCSLGEPHDAHEQREPDVAWTTRRSFGLAVRDERELERLRALGLSWRRGILDVSRVL